MSIIKHIRKIKGIVLLFSAVLFISSSMTVAQTENESIPVGVPIPLSGSLKVFGMMMKRSIEMARDQINESGGINGRELETIFIDEKGNPDMAEDVIHELIGRKVIIMTGGYSSDSTLELAKFADKADIPFLICTASADKITQQGWKNIYRLNPPVSEYSNGLKGFLISKIKPRSAAIIFENSIFGTNAATAMMGFCLDNAIEIRSITGYTKEKAEIPYLRPLVANLANDPPDFIYMASYLEDAIIIVKELRRLNLPSLLCGGAGGFTLNEFIDKAGDAANGVITATLWSKNPYYKGAEEYYHLYLERYSSPPDYHGAEAFSALLVVADVLKKAESFSSNHLRTALNKTVIQTPFGLVRFYSHGRFERQNFMNTQVLQIQNKKFEIIWPFYLSSADFVFPGKVSE